MKTAAYRQSQLATKRPRDSQRSKVYGLDEWIGNFVDGGEVMTDFEAGNFFQRVVRATDDDCVMKLRSGGRNSYGGFFGIRILPPHRRKHIILHELAHHRMSRRYRFTDIRIQSHGPEFVDDYLSLVSAFLHVPTVQLANECVSRRIRCAFTAKAFRW